MFRLTRSMTFPIGVDVGHDSVKMIQLERIGDQLSVSASARLPLPAEARTQPEGRVKAAAQVIRQMFRHGKNGFRGQRAVVAVPRDMLHVRNLRVPTMPLNELASVIGFEAKNVLPFDPAEATVQFIPAGEVRQGTESRQEVIILAVKNSDVDDFLDALNPSGLDLESLDVEPCALYRTVDRFVRRREDEQDVHVLVDVGSQRTQVVIGRGRDVSFAKPIDIGGRHLQEAVMRKLGVTPEEVQALRRRLAEESTIDEHDPVRQAANDATRALMEELGREISLCLRYYSVTFRGQRPTKVRLVGGEVNDGQLLAVLNRVLSIPAEAARVLMSVDTSRMSIEDRRGAMTAWALAFGLSLKCVEGTFGARDGKPREFVLPPGTPPAEVVDLNRELNAPEAERAVATLEATEVARA